MMKVFFKYTLFVFLGFMILISCNEEDCIKPIHKSSHESITNYEKRMEWFVNAKFGIMIHWGPVTLTGKDMSWSRYGYRIDMGSMPEWDPEKMTPAKEYDTLYKAFNPINFDADEWLELIKNSGAKYFVFTSKHHDGFCMFDTDYTNYKITSKESPYRKDICSMLSEAVHDKGIRLGWYYSPTDWYDPDYFTSTHSKYIEKMHGHISELMIEYGQVDLLWFDSGNPPHYWNSPELIRKIKAINSNVIMNNRSVYPRGDYITPEGHIPDFYIERPWEAVISISEYWSYKPGSLLLSAENCISMICLCAGRGGNLLLNITPGPDGSIEKRQQDILNKIGNFMNDYGDIIYNTKSGPYIFESNDLVSTYIDNTLNIMFLSDGIIEIKIPKPKNELLEYEAFNIDGFTFMENDSTYDIKIAGIDQMPGILSLKYKDVIDDSLLETEY